MPASNVTIYPDTITKVWADLEHPVTLAVGNDTLNYGTTTALGSSISAGQSVTVYSTVFIRTTADGAVNLRTYDDWDYPGDDVTESELEVLTEAPLNVKAYGAVGDGVTDDSAAFAAAIADIPNVTDPNYGPPGFPGITEIRGPEIYVPPGIYRVSEPIYIDKTVHLRGAQGGGDFSSTIIRPDDGVVGIFVAYDLSDSEDLNLAYGTVIQNIQVSAADPGTDPDGHGFFLNAKARLVNCMAFQCGGDGFHIHGDTGDSPATNANLWVVENCRSVSNGGHGFFVEGTDGNAGVAIMLDCSSNAGDGIHEASFLGNTYVACHTAGNGGAGYTKNDDHLVNRSVRIGCYTEGGQGDPDLWTAPASSVGDVTENYTDLFGGGPLMVARGTSRMWESSPLHVRLADASSEDVYAEFGVAGGDIAEGGVISTKLGATSGVLALRRSGDAVRWTVDGSAGQIPYQITLADHADPGRVQFPSGFYQSTGLGAAKWLSGNNTPEGQITANVGSLFTRLNGGANTTLYVKESGAGNTGWVAK